MTYDTPQWIRDDLKKKRWEERLKRIINNKFIQNLKHNIEENPIPTIAAIALVVTASAKLIDAVGRTRGSNAYARQVNYRIRKNR